MSEGRQRGIVKRFNDAKGFGFITLSDGSNRDVFVHFTAIQAKGYRKLAENDVVEFTVESGEKGLKASDVVVLEHASA